MCDTSQHHHLLHVDELRNVPLSSYFLGEVSIESHMSRSTGRSSLVWAWWCRAMQGIVGSADMNELLE